MNHPFMRLDTPELPFALPPPPQIDPLLSSTPVASIEENVYDNMLRIFKKHLTSDVELIEALTKPGQHYLKVIYHLLIRYHERSMEEYNMNEDYGELRRRLRLRGAPVLTTSLPAAALHTFTRLVRKASQEEPLEQGQDKHGQTSDDDSQGSSAACGHAHPATDGPHRSRGYSASTSNRSSDKPSSLPDEPATHRPNHAARRSDAPRVSQAHRTLRVSAIQCGPVAGPQQ